MLIFCSGYAFIEFETVEEADAATKALNDTMFEGNTIRSRTC